MAKNLSVEDRQEAEQLRASIGLDLDEIPQPLIIRQATDPGVNTIASCYLTETYIGTVIMTYLTIVCNYSKFVISHFGLSLPSKSTPFTLLPDPAGDSAPRIYKFSDYDGTRFDISQMIRHSGALRQGQSISGFLMGWHADPLENDLAQNAIVHGKLHITDQFENTLTRDLVLRVDRQAERAPKPRRTARRRRFLDQPDAHI